MFCQSQYSLYLCIYGEVLERLKRHAWKACNRQNWFAGSNPVLSANSTENHFDSLFFFAPFQDSHLLTVTSFRIPASTFGDMPATVDGSLCDKSRILFSPQALFLKEKSSSLLNCSFFISFCESLLSGKRD